MTIRTSPTPVAKSLRANDHPCPCSEVLWTPKAQIPHLSKKESSDDRFFVQGVTRELMEWISKGGGKGRIDVAKDVYFEFDKVIRALTCTYNGVTEVVTHPSLEPNLCVLGMGKPNWLRRLVRVAAVRNSVSDEDWDTLCVSGDVAQPSNMSARLRNTTSYE